MQSRVKKVEEKDDSGNLDHLSDSEDSMCVEDDEMSDQIIFNESSRNSCSPDSCNSDWNSD